MIPVGTFRPPTVTIGGVTYADTDNVPAISRRPELADLALVGTVLAVIA